MNPNPLFLPRHEDTGTQHRECTVLRRHGLDKAPASTRPRRRSGSTLVGPLCDRRKIAACRCSEARTVFPVLSDCESIGRVSRLNGFNRSRVAPHFPATHLMDSRANIRWIALGRRRKVCGPG